MSHQLATVLFFLGIFGLFWLDRDSKKRTSLALWIVVGWFLIAGSRNVGEWLSLDQPMEGDNAYLEGNPIDRIALGGMLAVGLGVLISRKDKVLPLIKNNIPIITFFVYCAVSSIWSDYPDVAFKRWFRGLGDIVVILVILSENDWLTALKRAMKRAGFFLIPVSLLFIMHYPALGRVYGRWDGKMYWTGVTTGKNTLGMVCMIFAIGSLWRVLDWFNTAKAERRWGQLIAHAVFVGMALLLLVKSNSMTSLACFAIAGTVMTAASFDFFVKRPALMHLMIWGLIAGAFCILFLGVGGSLLNGVGRDSSLTGRTDVWKVAIGLSGSPLLGTGYESFWLGSRLAAMRDVFQQHVNQVHNGYLEIYLNLGLVGCALLLTVIVTAYRKTFAALMRHEATGQLMIGYFIVAVVYDFTEGGFKMMYPVWIFFLLATILSALRSTPNAQTAVAESKPKKAPPRRPWLDVPATPAGVSLEEV